MTLIFQSTTTKPNDNELITASLIPDNGAKCARHYAFTEDECIVVSILTY